MSLESVVLVVTDEKEGKDRPETTDNFFPYSKRFSKKCLTITVMSGQGTKMVKLGHYIESLCLS